MLPALKPPYLLFLGDAPSLGHSLGGLFTLRTMFNRPQSFQTVNLGGFIPDTWLNSLIEAMEAGLDLVSGMHGRLADNQQLAAAALAFKRNLIDLRTPPVGLPVGNGRKRTGKRLLTVGTDCAVGKKYTALALTRWFLNRGLKADFRATGQTGIIIAGSGIPIDAVVGDFTAGAAEALSPDAHPDHWDVVEGQGSILHPSYAGVSLGLLHGTQPDIFVLCHDPGRNHMARLPQVSTPSITRVLDLTVALGRLTNPAIRCGGISLNTSKLSEADVRDLMKREENRLGFPVADPIRGGPDFARLAEACIGGGSALDDADRPHGS
jgi:uncharacterized NAD-dependent epimerase/dehydratase family protein